MVTYAGQWYVGLAFICWAALLLVMTALWVRSEW